MSRLLRWEARKSFRMMRSIRFSFSLAVLLSGIASAQPQEVPGMSLIPAGEFWMGRTFFFLPDAIGYFERDRQDDFPAHRIYLDAFYIDRYEVTNQEFARFLAAKGGPWPWHWAHGEIPQGEEKYPVDNVDWYQAEAYCGWAGKRLPTEAEWEKAARGGLDRNRYAWGNSLAGESATATPVVSGRRGSAKPPANAGSKGPVEVGKYPPNGYGLFDMIGNVWEWTNDWYAANHKAAPSCCDGAHNPRGGERDQSYD